MATLATRVPVIPLGVGPACMRHSFLHAATSVYSHRDVYQAPGGTRCSYS